MKDLVHHIPSLLRILKRFIAMAGTLADRSAIMPCFKSPPPGTLVAFSSLTFRKYCRYVYCVSIHLYPLLMVLLPFYTKNSFTKSKRVFLKEVFLWAQFSWGCPEFIIHSSAVKSFSIPLYLPITILY